MLLSDFKWAKARWAPQTQTTYDVAWRAFVRYAKAQGIDSFPAPPETVAAFLPLYAQEHSTSGVSLALCAIRAAHKDVRGSLPKTDPTREFYVLDDMVIVDAWKDVARTKGTKKTPKAALVTADLKKIIRGIPSARWQERAILLLTFASAMRRSEIAALNHEDIEIGDEGVTITIRRSKTDKLGKGETVAILRSQTDYCAVKALEDWIDFTAHDSSLGERARRTTGALFRVRNGKGRRIQPRQVATITKTWAAKAGFDPRQIGAHSLRRGCITSMFKAGTDIKNVMAHSRHQTVDIAMGYVEADRAMKNPGLKNLGL
jgi:integrase